MNIIKNELYDFELSLLKKLAEILLIEDYKKFTGIELANEIFEILKVTQKFKWTNNVDYEHIYEQIQKAGKNIQEWKDMNYKWEASSELAV